MYCLFKFFMFWATTHTCICFAIVSLDCLAVWAPRLCIVYNCHLITTFTFKIAHWTKKILFHLCMLADRKQVYNVQICSPIMPSLIEDIFEFAMWKVVDRHSQ